MLELFLQVKINGMSIHVAFQLRLLLALKYIVHGNDL